MKFNFLTVCEIFFKLKSSKFIHDIRTLESFGKILLIVAILCAISNKRLLIFLHSLPFNNEHL